MGYDCVRGRGGSVELIAQLNPKPSDSHLTKSRVGREPSTHRRLLSLWRCSLRSLLLCSLRSLRASRSLERDRRRLFSLWSEEESLWCEAESLWCEEESLWCEEEWSRSRSRSWSRRPLDALRLRRWLLRWLLRSPAITQPRESQQLGADKDGLGIVLYLVPVGTGFPEPYWVGCDH